MWSVGEGSKAQLGQVQSAPQGHGPEVVTTAEPGHPGVQDGRTWSWGSDPQVTCCVGGPPQSWTCVCPVQKDSNGTEVAGSARAPRDCTASGRHASLVTWCWVSLTPEAIVCMCRGARQRPVSVLTGNTALQPQPTGSHGPRAAMAPRAATAPPPPRSYSPWQPWSLGQPQPPGSRGGGSTLPELAFLLTVLLPSAGPLQAWHCPP